MRIVVKENSISAINANDEVIDLNIGALDVRTHGFQVVDYSVEQLYTKISPTEDVLIIGDTLESKMIARKIEDKIGRAVSMSDGLKQLASY